LIAVAFLILGLVFTVLCFVQVVVSYRTISRYIDTHTPQADRIDPEEPSQ
jgi:hypothetical protein